MFCWSPRGYTTSNTPSLHICFWAFLSSVTARVPPHPPCIFCLLFTPDKYRNAHHGSLKSPDNSALIFSCTALIVAFFSIYSDLWPSSCLCAHFICGLQFNGGISLLLYQAWSKIARCVCSLLICLIPLHFSRMLSELCIYYLNTPVCFCCHLFFLQLHSRNIIPLFKPECLYLLPGAGTLPVSCDRWNVAHSHDHTPSAIKQRRVFRAVLSDQLQFSSMDGDVNKGFVSPVGQWRHIWLNMHSEQIGSFCWCWCMLVISADL